MIEVNLLPHREAKRAYDLKQNVALLVLGLVVVGGVALLMQQQVSSSISNAQTRLASMQSAIDRLKPQQQKVEAFKAKKQQLESKLEVIRGLDQARSGPVRVMDELSAHTPERLWFTAITTKGKGITLAGQSLDNALVADLLRGLNTSPYFVDVDLDKTTLGKEVNGVQVVEFTIQAGMSAPSPKTEGEGASES
ncbi:MAG: PilN domain-containing protein [Proteobacteria bacterium]|nr:PilN domain-containing protein [Pseudomonadota bacterium]